MREVYSGSGVLSTIVYPLFRMEVGTPMSFSSWLRNELNSLDILPADLARRMGMSSTGRISEWMTGKIVPSSKSCVRIAQALNIDEDVVLIAAGHKTPDPHFDPDSATARLSPLIEQIDWASRPGRLEEMENELRFMVDADRRKRQIASNKLDQ